MTIHQNSPMNSEAADWSGVAPVLDAVIDELAERDRTAVLLRFMERRAFVEIGAALGVSEDAARMRVERALDKLHALLSRRGIKSSSAALGVALANHAVVAAPGGLAAAATGLALGSATTTAGLLSLMSASKLTGVVVGALLVAALGIAWREQNLAHAAEAELAAARVEERALQARRQEIERRLAAANQAALAAAALAAAKNTAASAAPAEPAAWNAVAEGDAFIERHPAVKQALIAAKDAAGRALYRDFFATAHLTAEEIERLLEIQRGDSSVGFPYGPGGQLLMLRVGTDMPYEERTKQLRDLLGEERFKQFQAQGQRGDAIRQTATLAASMAFTDTPLGADQSSALIEAMMAARIRGPGIRRLEYNWEAALGQAKEFLSDPQMAELSRVAARATARAQEERARAETKVSTAPAAPKP